MILAARSPPAASRDLAGRPGAGSAAQVLTGHFKFASLAQRDLVGRLEEPAAGTGPPGSRAAVPLWGRPGVSRHGAGRRRTPAASDVPAAHRNRAVWVHRS